jgi:hypothetical protein
MIVVPYVSQITIIEILILNVEIHIHLYKNDVPLENDTVITDLVEANYPGYASQIASGWSSAETIARRAQTSAEPLTFSRTGTTAPQDIFGYYATTATPTILLWVERAERPPFPMRVATDNILVVPRFSLRGEPRKLRTGL